jgi:drug/metabolite transporter (DMT)-like permease
MVVAKYVLAALAVAFLILGAGRLIRDRGRLHPQSRTWLLIAAIFGGVSAWLFYAT